MSNKPFDKVIKTTIKTVAWIAIIFGSVMIGALVGMYSEASILTNLVQHVNNSTISRLIVGQVVYISQFFPVATALILGFFIPLIIYLAMILIDLRKK